MTIVVKQTNVTHLSFYALEDNCSEVEGSMNVKNHDYGSIDSNPTTKIEFQHDRESNNNNQHPTPFKNQDVQAKNKKK